MKYFKDSNNVVFAYTDEQVELAYNEESGQSYLDNFEEIENPILDGKVLEGHKNISQVATKEDGSFYRYYNEDGTPDTDKIMAEQTASDLLNKVSEARAYLISTDHKFFNKYKPKDGEDLDAIEAKRDEARQLIRSAED